MALLPLGEDSLFSGGLFAAASIGRVAAIFLAADGALTEHPTVQAMLLLLGCGLSAAISRLLEGGLTWWWADWPPWRLACSRSANRLLHQRRAEGVSFAPAGGLYTSVSTNSSAFFHPRSEFDAFAAALPAAGGLVALGGMSAFVGEESADWRDGWGVWHHRRGFTRGAPCASLRRPSGCFSS